MGLLRAASASVLRSVPFPGRYRVYEVLSSILGDEPLPFTVPLQRSTRLRVESPFWQHMYYLGDFDGAIRWFMQKQLSASAVVFDVGASIGIYTLPTARRALHVYAFEALESNFDLLTRNIAANNLQNVSAVFCAVSDQIGVITAPVREGGNYSLASEGVGFSTIPTITLDDFAAEHRINQIDLLKMDIEGSETKACRGARRLFTSGAIRMAVVEFNPHWLAKMGSSADELYDLFEEYGLAVHFLTRFGGARATSRAEVMSRITSPESYFDLVLTPWKQN